MTARSFVPAGAVTGIGSLPFTSPTEAVRAVAAACSEVPFWPQLPMLSAQESILGQGLGVLAGWIEERPQGYGYEVREGAIDAAVQALHRSTGELSAANAAGFGAFQEAVASGTFGSAVAVKGQIEGPMTLSAFLFYKDRPFLSDPALFAAVSFHISQIVCWQIDRLKAAGLPVLLFVDEPALCLAGSEGIAVSEERQLDALAAILEGARLRGALAGLHCCAARPFSRMFRAQPDILSFDAHEGLEWFFSDAEAKAFARRGGTVAYGMIPTLRDLSAVRAEHLFTRWLTAASLAGDPQEFASHAMITATCGLGLLDPAAVTESFRLARRLGGLMGALAANQLMAASEAAGS